jgi:inhibitor of KinA sporulation pathway (predicted exonuclease)
MNYIVLDIEATCDDKMKIQNEIIEIGAVKLNEDLEIVGEFQIFIKPILNPTLTDFCKELTKIKQSDVDQAVSFKEALEKFLDFCGKDYYLTSWGFYDKTQFIKDCELHKLPTEWTNKHISLKHQHQNILKLRKGVGVQRALNGINEKFEGTHHRGIDDAKNITKLFKHYFKQWKF